MWYRYRPTSTATVTISTCGSTNSYDTVISAYTGTCGALTQIACNDDSCALLSQTTFSGTAGVTYYIRVAGFQGATGNFTLTVTGGGGVIPPANDDCSARAGMGLGPTAFSTVGATTDGITHATCGGQVNNDIWYNHPAQATGVLTISTCNAASFDTRIAVYDGNGCTDYATRLLACNDNAAGCGTTSQLNVNVVQGQNYTIRIGGATTATGTGTVTLTMGSNTPPSISQQPASTSACVGGSASFTVVASGSPAPTYQWRKNTVNLANGGNISGATSATLTINPVGATDGATYDVVVTNVAGSVTSNGAVLTVNNPISITTQPPTSISVCENTNTGMSVVASGSGTISYQWKRNGVNLTNGGNIVGANTANLSLSPALAGSGGNYTCDVTNVCGTVTSNTCVLTVNTAPNVTTDPTSQTVNAGVNVQFSVVATGTAPLSYQWRRNGSNLSNGGNISGATNATLTITAVAEANEGSYDCVVTNGCGNDTSLAATLTVNPVPCAGDLNGDGLVDLVDLTTLLANFGTASGATAAMGDMDADGDIDLGDLTAFLARFGVSC